MVRITTSLVSPCPPFSISTRALALITKSCTFTFDYPVELAIRHGYLHVHRRQADVERLCVVEVVHAPVFGSQPFDDLWYGLVNGLLPRGRPFRDVPDIVRVYAIPEGFQAVHDLLAVHVEAEVIVELGQQPRLRFEIPAGGQVVG